MEIATGINNGVYIFKLTGRLDASTSAEFEDKILDVIINGNTDILIDFSDLEFISSSGLRVLLIAAKKIKAEDGSIKICGIKKHIYEVFEIAGFTPLFEFKETCD